MKVAMKDTRESTVVNSLKMIITEYSALALTKEKDKLVALAGVARKISEWIKNPYLAGLWQEKNITN